MQKLSKDNLKEFSKLKQKKYRQQQGLVIVEGTRLIEQLSKNYVEIRALFVVDESDIPAYLSKQTLIYQLQSWQLEKITTTQNPQNIAALVPTNSPEIKKTSFLLYLDGVKEPGNLGAIFRTACAADVDGIILSPDCCEIYNPKVIRASLGTVFSLPSAVKDIDWLKIQTSHLLVTSLQQAENLYELPKKQRDIILVLGSEADGIRKEICDIADQHIKIPISAQIESLNVAVAAGIFIFHLKNL